MTIADYISRAESESRENVPQKENHSGPEPKVQTGTINPAPASALFPHLRLYRATVLYLQENGTGAQKAERNPSRRSPSKGVTTPSENLTMVNGVS